ncbi:MAG: DUF4382 domain-containing protein [Deltaproteobacteria bacterium]|nr:DUF4382 domain-containing protein [Deltaproteobacteria bacterium]
MRIGTTTLAVWALGAACACDTNLEPSTLTLKLTARLPVGIEAATVAIDRIEVHLGADSQAQSLDPASEAFDADGNWKGLQVGRAVDLAGLQSETQALTLGDVLLNDGRIDQLRIFLQSGAASTATANGKPCTINLAKVPKSGIKITTPFKPFRSGRNLRHAMIVDLPLDKALAAAGGCYDLKPLLTVRKFWTEGKAVAVD